MVSILLNRPFSSPTVASYNLGAETMKALGCKGYDLECAQGKAVDEIQDAQTKAMASLLSKPENAWVAREAIFRPVVDGSFILADFPELTQRAQFSKEVNILWGTTRDEYGSFLTPYFPKPIPFEDAERELATFLKDTIRTGKFINSTWYPFDSSDPDSVRNVFTKAATDLYFICPLQAISRKVAASNKGKVYTYMMDFGRTPSDVFGTGPPPFCKDRVCHCSDIVPTFGSGDVMKGVNQTGDDARFARHVIDRFTVFARTGNPNPRRGLSGPASQNQDLLEVQWIPYTNANPIYHFNVTNSAVASNADTARCDWVAKNVQFDAKYMGLCELQKSRD